MRCERRVDMEFLGKDATKTLVPLTGFGVGLLAWEYQATSKWIPGWGPGGPPGGYNLLSRWRFADALGALIGTDLVRKSGIGGSKWNNGNVQLFNPNAMGWLNKTFGAGIALKIANALIRKYVKAYENVDAIPDMIDAAANGLAVGGAIGGIFDPSPSQGQNNASISQGERLNAVEQLNVGLRM
jgi:hypothetical protein